MARNFEARYSTSEVYDMLRGVASAHVHEYGLYEYTGAVPHLCAYAIPFACLPREYYEALKMRQAVDTQEALETLEALAALEDATSALDRSPAVELRELYDYPLDVPYSAVLPGNRS